MIKDAETAHGPWGLNKIKDANTAHSPWGLNKYRKNIKDANGAHGDGAKKNINIQKTLTQRTVYGG